MDCNTCRGSPLPGMIVTEFGVVLCPNGCIGGIASCCDAAGSAQPELRRGAGCGGGPDGRAERSMGTVSLTLAAEPTSSAVILPAMNRAVPR